MSGTCGWPSSAPTGRWWRTTPAGPAGGIPGTLYCTVRPGGSLCKAAYLASNQGPDGQWDGQGLRAEQIQGFGLGVMNARAAYFAKQDPRFRSFLLDGRSYGPHGQGLVIANSLSHYDDGLSRELTELVATANLRIRELGFKPYVAPAISSGAMQLLLTLRRSWHCSSVALGGIWFGVRNRLTAGRSGNRDCLFAHTAVRAAAGNPDASAGDHLAGGCRRVSSYRPLHAALPRARAGARPECSRTQEGDDRHI